MGTEKNFETKIKMYLEEKGCWFLKYWGGAVYTKTGVPDLIVCCDGFFVAVEVKAPNGKPSELQKHTLKEINRKGGYAVILQPDQFELFKKMIDMLQESHTWEACEITAKINERWGV